MRGTGIIRAVLDLSLIMQGVNPYELKYIVKWENPAAQDPIEEAHAYEQARPAAIAPTWKWV